ncbi:MAG TPA: carboxyvinyl-carboxyphosphonate phosphorylmutase [Actinobacteria bacterium]|nr:carboxyvinyl-carboxyphosphonate phosphorylmutase [Actinomycetota bacterium]
MARLLRSRGRTRSHLRELISHPLPVLAPGCYDALSARLVEEAGFPVAYMTGFGSSAGYLGRPDVGLMTMADMVDNARRIVDAVDIPVIADADTGYGNPINVIRTVQTYERAGVAAIHIEDQVAPKKCGHMDGKQVVPPDEMAAKIRAAADARSSPDFLLIARTDARAVEGLDAAIERARLYREAGADILFIEAPQSAAEIRAIAAAFPQAPLLFNYAEGGKTPAVEHSLLTELGFAVIIFPISTLLAATKAMRGVLKRIKEDGSPIGVLSDLPRFDDFLDFIGLPEILELEQRYKVVEEGDP